MFFLALFIILILILVLKYVRNRRVVFKIAKHFNALPNEFILGSIRFIPKDPLEIFQKVMDLSHQYGLNFIIWGPLNFIHLVINEPKDVEMILTTKTTVKGGFYDFLAPWLGEGLLLSSGEKWFQRRRILTPSFHFKILEKFIEIFNRQDEKLVEKLQKYADNDEEVDIYRYISLCALDNVCEAAMGVSINALDDPDSEYINAVKEFGDILFYRIWTPLLAHFHFLFNLSPAGWRQRRIIKKLHQFTDSVISQRKAQLKEEAERELKEPETESKPSFLDILLHATINDRPLSHLDIREEVDTFAFEGHDTTTSGIVFCLYHLAMNPDIQQKVFEESYGILGCRSTVTYENLQNMKYLEMVIKESMRIHPPVPVILRKTTETIEIGDAKIPPGIDISIHIYSMHHNPEIFPNPEKFIPERHSEEGQRSRGHFDYIPFSAGNRNCIGQRFAMLEMKSILAVLVKNFEIIPTEATRNLRYTSDMVLRPVDGLKLKLGNRMTMKVLPFTMDNIYSTKTGIYQYTSTTYSTTTKRVVNRYY